jgi:hypothetical protein
MSKTKALTVSSFWSLGHWKLVLVWDLVLGVWDLFLAINRTPSSAYLFF